MRSKLANNDPPEGHKQRSDSHERDQDFTNDQTLKEFEQLVAELAQPIYLFRLYVSGTSPRSALAIANVRQISASNIFRAAMSLRSLMCISNQEKRKQLRSSLSPL